MWPLGEIETSVPFSLKWDTSWALQLLGHLLTTWLREARKYSLSVCSYLLAILLGLCGHKREAQRSMADTRALL